MTHQQKKVHVVNNKPVFYEPPELQKARLLFRDHMIPYVPDKPHTRGVRLIVKWCFPVTGKHKPGDYKLTKPDTDNLIKLLKDVMTDLKFWKDDALVASEINEKFYNDVTGIYVRIEKLEEIEK